jgi:hypothetical protein
MIVETWLNVSDPVVIEELTLPGYSFLSAPRGRSTYGGGIGALFKTELNLQTVDIDMSFPTFEFSCFSNISKEVFYFVVYRPHPSKVNGLKTSEFLIEFDIFLEYVGNMNSKTIIVGDFNMWVDTPSKYGVPHFLTTIDNAGFCQHVIGPTHKDGHTLDLVMSRLEENLITHCEVDLRLSDHNVVLLGVLQQRPKLKKIKVVSRRLNSVDQQAFQADLAREFASSSHSDDVNDLVACYDDSVTLTLDKHAPVKCTTRSARAWHPWYDNDIHHARRLRRKLERKWRKSRLQTDRQVYIEQRTATNVLIETSKQNYYKKELEHADCKTVFKKVNGLLGNNVKILPALESAQELSDDFAAFFDNKVRVIYHGFGADSDHAAPPPVVACSHTRSQFDLLSDEEVVKAINNAPTKSCTLDPVPTWFLKQNIQTFTPIITRIINESLSKGTFPQSLKHSVVTPLIKKPSLDRNVLKNYRPVSNLSFVSKLIEKQACKIINEYIDKNQMGEQLQSAYKKAHSTETALMKVKDDVMACLAQHQGVFLVLLDLSSAFDTVSHDILLNRHGT